MRKGQSKYDHKIEKKWQKFWAKEKIFLTRENPKKKKFYVLDMFPYPSGEGLHVGHPRGYIATDVYSRFKKMSGYNVLHPMGWDAFGLPAEQFAIKNKVQPRIAVAKNIKRYKEQLSMIGFNYDWTREINTTDPEYYKWTQWTFLQMYKKGLAYQSWEPINWCPSCQTGLANEDVEEGKCERCGTIVEKKPMRQWVIAITKYADRLLRDLEDLNWPESVKESQRNWIGKKTENGETTYNIRDWVFSRQRYWGEPIPIIHCEACGVVPVPEKDLPVMLPQVKSYAPTGTGESPLADISKWVNVNCPNCKQKAKRETNTMPQWAGSSWYYLRYMDPKNKKELVSKSKEKYWSPVDMYVGGTEHATRHLIYARFWHKFLFDIKVVSGKEPFSRLKNQGLILATDGRKMSKRWGNVVNPDEIVKTYGADTLRVYEMFMGPFDASVAWSTESIIGSRRFLEKVWRIQEKIVTSVSKEKKEEYSELEKILHKTIKKVGEDIEEMNFNTAISQMMILANVIEKIGYIKKSDYRSFITILSPFAPHMCEELWSILGEKKSIYLASWPKYEMKLIVEEKITLVITVNGKVRSEISVDKDIDENEAIKLAMTDAKIQPWIEGKIIKKTIYVPGRIVNIVAV